MEIKTERDAHQFYLDHSQTKSEFYFGHLPTKTGNFLGSSAAGPQHPLSQHYPHFLGLALQQQQQQQQQHNVLDNQN